MGILFKKTFKDKVMLLLLLSVASICIVLLYVSIFPSIQRQAVSYNTVIMSLPKSYLRAFNIGGTSLSEFNSYIATEYCSLFLPLFVILLALSFSSDMLAGAIEKRTIGLELSMPFSRKQIFTAKYLTGALYIGIFIAIAVFSLVPVAALFHIGYHISDIIILFLVTLLFGLSILSISFMISSLFSKKGHVIISMGIVMLCMYILNLVAGLILHLDGLKYLSLFYYFNLAKAVTDSYFTSQMFLVFALCAVLGFSVGLFCFRRRDILV